MKKEIVQVFATIGLFADETMGRGGLLSYDTLVLAASGAAVGIFALVQKIHKAKTFCIGPKNLQCKHILCIDPIKNLLGRNIFRFPKYLCIVHLLNIHNCNFVILHCGIANLGFMSSNG